MGKFIDLTGQKFGRLTVIHRVENDKYGKPRWLCKCDCGNEHYATTHNLRSGHVKSCGCLQPIVASLVNTTHGATKQGKCKRLYWVWAAIIQRCENPKNKAYCNYGGRGICICQQWKDNFAEFRKWALANGYTDGLEIDRIDVNGNYEPDNCRFVRPALNAENKRAQHNSTTGISGVWRREKQNDYRVTITANNKRKHIGVFKTFGEAKEARKQAELQYWGWTKIE